MFLSLKTFSGNWFLRLVSLSFGSIIICYLFLPVHKDHTGVSIRNTSKLMADATSASSIVASGRPYILYGTAWKKEETTRLVKKALKTGFRFIDTACQPKHYNEAGVGEGVLLALDDLKLDRSEIFLQTKFTSLDGQDPSRLPYDRAAPLEEQVKQSIHKSLENLRTTYIDRLVLHSPMHTFDKTIAVWRVFESFVDAGLVRNLGISNCYDIETFSALYEKARIKPSALQNRFYSESGFDVELRQFCKDNKIVYQSFWTLSANREALSMPGIVELASTKNLTPQTLMYAYMMTLGHTPLSGTTNQLHMAEDVAIMERILGGEKILSINEVNYISEKLGVPVTNHHS